MKHGLDHYINKALSIVWYSTIIIGSVTLLIFMCLLFLKVIGVL